MFSITKLLLNDTIVVFNIWQFTSTHQSVSATEWYCITPRYFRSSFITKAQDDNLIRIRIKPNVDLISDGEPDTFRMTSNREHGPYHVQGLDMRWIRFLEIVWITRMCPCYSCKQFSEKMVSVGYTLFQFKTFRSLCIKIITFGLLLYA